VIGPSCNSDRLGSCCALARPAVHLRIIKRPDDAGLAGSVFAPTTTSHQSHPPLPALSAFLTPHKEHAIRRDFSVTLELLSSQEIKDRLLKNRRLRCTGEI
jgi:hypothetical protein